MKPHIQHVSFIGRLSAEPAKSGTKEENAVFFNLSTTLFHINTKGEPVYEIHWYKMLAWGQTAAIVTKHLHKGMIVAVEGLLQKTRYGGIEGQINEIREIWVRDMIWLVP
jgi:single-stranded DNA-binding protein